MKLYDPERPTINHKPAFTSGQAFIPRIQLWPLEYNLIELSMMLPLIDDRFSGKYFTCQIPLDCLEAVISEFTQDPEKFVSVYLDTDLQGLRPAIWGQKPHIPSPRTSKPEPPILSFTDLMISAEK